MTKRQTIVEVLAALAAAGAVILLLTGCSVEHRADSTIYRFGIEPPTCSPDRDCGLPVVGPASKPALPDEDHYQ